MLSRFAQFLFITILVFLAFVTFHFAGERIDQKSSIAGQAIAYGPECEGETDAGFDVSSYGELYVPSVDITMKDICRDKDKLSEFGCSSNGVTRTYFSCNSVGAICSGGACVSTKFGDSKEHVVLLDDTGFSPDDLVVKVGETVTWVNVREQYDSALLIGAQRNTHIKSEMLAVGETYSYTFSEEDVGRNVFVDGILISYEHFVYVE